MVNALTALITGLLHYYGYNGRLLECTQGITTWLSIRYLITVFVNWIEGRREIDGN
jgi:hypothetical protein